MAAAAVAAGAATLWLVGAPPRLILLNLAALAVGGVAAALLAPAARLGAGGRALLLLAAGLAPVATAVWGESLAGVARWVTLGPLTVQPAAVLVPPLAIAFAARPDRTAALAVALAAAGLALQPDRGIAGALALGVVLTAARELRGVALAAAAAVVCAFAATLLRTDAAPPVRFTEGVLALAVRTGPAAAVAAALSCLLLLAPAGLRRRHPGALGYAGVWAGVLGASLLGPYPTPVAGAGASAVLGLCLSLAPLGPPGRERRG